MVVAPSLELVLLVLAIVGVLVALFVLAVAVLARPTGSAAQARSARLGARGWALVGCGLLLGTLIGLGQAIGRGLGEPAVLLALGVVVATVVMVVVVARRRPAERLPRAVLAALVAAMVGVPLGMFLLPQWAFVQDLISSVRSSL